MNPEERFKAAMAAADAIFAKVKSEGRSSTQKELEEVTKHLDEAEGLKAQIDAAKRAKALTGGLFDGDDLVIGAEAGTGFKAQAAARLVTKAHEVLTERFGAEGGAKALVGGVVGVGQLLPDVATTPGRPTSVLQLVQLETRKPADDVGNKFSYQRQSVRDNNASSVADGQVKPTSTYTFTEEEDSFRTVAHLSEEYPLRFLEDHKSFTEILQSQMAEGLLEEVERLVLEGDEDLNGTVGHEIEDQWNGIRNTVGIQTQAAITGDILGTLSAARYKLITAHQQPTGWVMNPTDVAELELMREDGATGPLMFRSGRSQIEEVIGAGIPIVTSSLVAAGTAIVADWSEARLIPRDQAELAIDKSGTKFTTNSWQARLEQRLGFYVRRPVAFVVVTLPA